MYRIPFHSADMHSSHTGVGVHQVYQLNIRLDAGDQRNLAHRAPDKHVLRVAHVRH